MVSTGTSRLGGSLVLSSVLAILSFIPFQIVAQTTLFVCIALFVLDPIPPLSRLLSLFLCGLVLVLTRLERNWRNGQATIEEIAVTDNSQKKDQ